QPTIQRFRLHGRSWPVCRDQSYEFFGGVLVWSDRCVTHGRHCGVKTRWATARLKRHRGPKTCGWLIRSEYKNRPDRSDEYRWQIQLRLLPQLFVQTLAGDAGWPVVWTVQVKHSADRHGQAAQHPADQQPAQPVPTGHALTLRNAHQVLPRWLQRLVAQDFHR